MTKSLYVAGPLASVGGGTFPVLGGSGRHTTEDRSQVSCAVAGAFSNLAVQVDNTGTGRAIRLRKNGFDANLEVAPTDTTAGRYTDATNTDTVIAGDLIALSNVVTTTLYSASLLFEAASGHVALYSAAIGSGTSFTFNLATNYINLAGSPSVSSTEASRTFLVRTPGTLKGAQLYVSSNGRITTTTFRSRINGADGAISIAVTAGNTGLFTDTTNTDSLASGDLVCWSVTTGSGNGTMGLESISCAIETASGSNDLFTSSGSSSRTASATASYYVPGASMLSSTAESRCNIQHGFSATVSRLRCSITFNTYTSSATVTLRKNSVAGTQVLTISAGTTGTFEDTTNFDAFGPADDFSLEVVGGTSGTLTISYIAVTEQDQAAGTGNIFGTLALGALTSAGAVAVGLAITGTLALGAVTTTGLVEGPGIHVNGVLTLGTLTTAGSVTVPRTVSGSVSLGALTTSGNTGVLHTLGGTLTLDALTVSGLALPGLVATGTVALGDLTTSGAIFVGDRFALTPYETVTALTLTPAASSTAYVLTPT